jgi:hypothetical protein
MPTATNCCFKLLSNFLFIIMDTINLPYKTFLFADLAQQFFK